MGVQAIYQKTYIVVEIQIQNCGIHEGEYKNFYLQREALCKK